MHKLNFFQPIAKLDLAKFITLNVHFVKSLRIPSKSPYPVQMRENTGQKNSEYGHISRSGSHSNTSFSSTLL